ncbi:uncharacterized protein EV420DRAFT_1474846 [Desarmillaria tabescens]|uniref:Peptidase A1 domain-containing protein n=1 Tax=Armillaria tabescens TaxID=1929756 RepID=A0AA39TTL2_ARMTA|nr:uncharacterized protein EV420DRAFT_1474846 [Desarmillaria tabescens]KAK0466033.1 hypothetical protein EV420DRAFT_1474846 [Desarmillaria tabescens]
MMRALPTTNAVCFLFLSTLAFAYGAPSSLTGDLIDALGGTHLHLQQPNSQTQHSRLHTHINITKYVSLDYILEDPIILGITDSSLIKDMALTQDGSSIISLGYLDLINPDV